MASQSSMSVKDRIYGDFTINSPVIIELLSSEPLARLKNIAQFGIPDEFYHKKNYSRFEHSLGVMLLLKKLGAPEEEQVAGLLHDVSHTAFSHAIDWVLSRDNRTEDFQDSQHEKIINNSEIPAILKKYNYSSDRICNYHRYGLLEREIPDVCADRLDYSLREMPPLIFNQCLAGITTYKGKIVFDNQNTAHMFAKNFLKLQAEHWGGYEAVTRYKLFARALRRALELKIITLDDFWRDDVFVTNKVKLTTDNEIQGIFKILRNRSLDKFPKETVATHKKFRYVDPEFLVDGQLIRLSSVNDIFKQEMLKAQEENTQGVYAAIIQ